MCGWKVGRTEWSEGERPGGKEGVAGSERGKWAGE